MALGVTKGLNGANYIAEPHKQSLRAPLSRMITLSITFFIAFAIILGTSASGLISSQSVAYAQSDEDLAVISESANEYFADDDEEKPYIERLLNGIKKGVEGNYSSEASRNSFGYIVKRLFSIQYLNWVDKASKNRPENGQQCNINNKHAGTLMYHNCDVPNYWTEQLQTIVAVLVPTGPIKAEKTNARTPFGFGLPSTIPGASKSVPTNPDERNVKYSALELFGYNLRYTSYKGEWDRIEVMNSARMLANFSFMDKVTLGAKSIVNGVVAGVTEGASNFADKVTQGNILGAVGGFFGGLWGGGLSGGLNAIIDTSDNNVFEAWGWYRVGYGATLYGARELSHEERSAFMKEVWSKIFQNDLKKMPIPPDLAAIEAGPPKPIEAISSCHATLETKDANGNVTSSVEKKLSFSTPEGPSEADCKESAAASPYFDDTPTWSKDGERKAETLAAWTSTNAAILDTAAKYNMSCKMGTDEANRADNILKFYACWEQSWEPAAIQAQKDAQDAENNQWYEKKISPEEIAKFFEANPQYNVNAPWMRYVCTDPKTGKDLKNGTDYRFLYNQDSSTNCPAVRPPIQNGYFGNGYDLPYKSGTETQPEIDTRWSAMPDYGLWNILIPWTIWSDPSSIANMGLNFSKGLTQLSNTIIDLSFAPILSTLGVGEKITDLIEAFNESLYMPFVVLVIALAGLQIIWRAGRHREYAQSFKNVLLVIGTFFIGVIIMTNPNTVIKLVDEVPAEIETAMVGAIFSLGLDGDEVVCSASSSIQSGGYAGLGDESYSFSPSAAVRTMECEVWRSFVFAPYVEGQWGTHFNNLYAKGYGPGGTNSFNNQNTTLVGNAAVKMGGGTTVHNWALYQLDVLSSGTATTIDPSDTVGVIPRDFYRIVDLQAGPNNGAASDGRYFDSWSGQHTGYRTTVGLLSGFVSLIGFITILVYAFFKIEVTIVSTLMLLFLPFVLLMGLHPSWGRMQLKKYTGTIIGLMLKRVMLVIMLAVMIKILTTVASASSSYPLMAVIMIALCGLFLIYRKEIENMVMQSTENAFGGSMGRSFTDNPRAGLASSMPLTVRNQAAIARSTGIGFIAGSTAGFIDNGFKGARKGAGEAIAMGTRQIRNSQRRTGMSMFTKADQAARKGKQSAEGIVRAQNEKKIKAKNEAQQFSQRRKSKALGDEDGNRVNAEFPEFDNGKANTRNIARLAQLNSEIDGLENSRQRIENKAADIGSEKLDPKKMQAEQQNIVKQKRRIESEILKRKEERDLIMTEMDHRNDPNSTWEAYQNDVTAVKARYHGNEEIKAPLDVSPTGNAAIDALGGAAMASERLQVHAEKRDNDIEEMQFELNKMRQKASEAREGVETHIKEVIADKSKAVKEATDFKGKREAKRRAKMTEEQRYFEDQRKATIERDAHFDIGTRRNEGEQKLKDYQEDLKNRNKGGDE